MAPPHAQSWGGASASAAAKIEPLRIKSVLPLGSRAGRHAAVRVNCLPERVRIANSLLAKPGQKPSK
jgi:hypothetical protein